MIPCPDRSARRHRAEIGAAALALTLGILLPPGRGANVDTTPLPLAAEIAFPNLKWTGWAPVTDDGKPLPLRPTVLTHAPDGSNRIFVVAQRGVIHVFPNDQRAEATGVFLDIRPQVVYQDKENEEGLLGLAFHPRYRENGAFFLYYTTSEAPHTSVVRRYRVRPTDANRAQPRFEEELLRIKQPFWNHNGGGLLFGPDGYLYIALGDGGKANDPFGNGQNLKTLLGSILRIDVDRKEAGRNYAIPPDNPFAGRPGGARPEIWAYGLRNVWGMAFDRQTGRFWAADVGQDLWEEIDLIVRGGNYGWNFREATHRFGPAGSGPGADLVEPIWEYHHDIGKSITGGHVYRGRRLPELDGAYLYADYISGQVWSLRYDAERRQVTANRPIATPKLPITSFGEDPSGDVYFTVVAADGKALYRFVRSSP